MVVETTMNKHGHAQQYALFAWLRLCSVHGQLTMSRALIRQGRLVLAKKKAAESYRLSMAHQHAAHQPAYVPHRM
jgi:hypothetical protein